MKIRNFLLPGLLIILINCQPDPSMEGLWVSHYEKGEPDALIYISGDTVIHYIFNGWNYEYLADITSKEIRFKERLETTAGDVFEPFEIKYKLQRDSLIYFSGADNEDFVYRRSTQPTYPDYYLKTYLDVNIELPIAENGTKIRSQHKKRFIDLFIGQGIRGPEYSFRSGPVTFEEIGEEIEKRKYEAIHERVTFRIYMDKDLELELLSPIYSILREKEIRRIYLAVLKRKRGPEEFKWEYLNVVVPSDFMLKFQEQL